MTSRLSAVWWTVLTVVLAGGYLWIGAASPLPAIRWPALAGGALVLAGLWLATRSRPAALLVLVVGALTPVVTGWWSLVVPLTAVLIIPCGTVAVWGVLGGARPRDTAAPGGRAGGRDGRGPDLPARPGSACPQRAHHRAARLGGRPGVELPPQHHRRTTGRRRTTPVTLVEADGHRWLVSPYGQVGWVRNVRATPEVSLRRGRTTQVLGVREVDAETAGPVLRRYVGQMPVTAPFFAAEAGDPVEAFVAEAPRHPVFALDG